MIKPLAPGGIPASADASRWRALLARESGNADFIYAVATTGVYCRTGCPARLPKRENALFFASGEEAEKAGFRPCARCRPDEETPEKRQAGLVAGLCEVIRNSAEPPTLGTLAARAGMSASHLRRLFRRVTGVTPKAYAKAVQAERLRQGLGGAATVTEIIYGAGFGSAGHFYGQSDAILGMTPTAWRKGGEKELIRYAIRPCSLGLLLAAQARRGICAISLGDDREKLVASLRASFPVAALAAEDAALDGIMAAIVAFVDDPAGGLDLPLDIRGTAFQCRVWRALRDIPAGKTMSYAEVAAQLGMPEAARAVARACAANTLAVAIPCHRVVRSNRALSGYRWGTGRKMALLEAEAKAAGNERIGLAGQPAPAPCEAEA